MVIRDVNRRDIEVAINWSKQHHFKWHKNNALNQLHSLAFMQQSVLLHLHIVSHGFLYSVVKIYIPMQIDAYRDMYNIISYHTIFYITS